MSFAAAAKTPYGVDELTVAGGLLNQPIEVVPGRTVDLMIPAQAEQVIEGFVSPGEMQLEGPFGEALGYMNEAAPAAVIRVTALGQRQGAIHHGYLQQLPPSEGHVVMEMGLLGPLWHALTRRLRIKGLRTLAIAPGSAGVATLVAQVDRLPRRDVVNIGKAIARINFGQRFLWLVDTDIEPRDAETLHWALSSRVDPARDITLVDGIQTFQLDPAVMARAEALGEPLTTPPYRTSMAIIDATVKCSVPALALPEADAMAKTLGRWAEWGLPPIRPRERLQRLVRSQQNGAPASQQPPQSSP